MHKYEKSKVREDYYGTVNVMDLNDATSGQELRGRTEHVAFLDDANFGFHDQEETARIAQELLDQMEAGEDIFAETRDAFFEEIGFVYAPYVPVHRTPDFLKDIEDNDMHVLNNMNITAKKDDILKKLHANRETHATVVKEARVGYVEAARKAVEAKLDMLKEGKLVALTFSLKPPQDHTKVYDTAIQMLELHTGDEIELDSQQVRTLVMDEWDWSQQFWASNKEYSSTADEVGSARGY